MTDNAKTRGGRRPVRRRRLFLAIAVTVVAFVLPGVGLVFAGRWLVVDDAVQPGRAVVVVGGEVPFRAMEAAAVYKQGWAREVWITTSVRRAEDVALARLGVAKPSEQVYNVEVVEKLGVPRAAIHILPEPVTNTKEEVAI